MDPRGRKQVNSGADQGYYFGNSPVSGSVVRCSTWKNLNQEKMRNNIEDTESEGEVLEEFAKMRVKDEDVVIVSI